MSYLRTNFIISLLLLCSFAYADSYTTIQSECTANKSIKINSLSIYKKMFIKFTLPDLTGYTVSNATLDLVCSYNSNSLTGINIYAGSTGAWDESSTASTLDALSLGTAAVSSYSFSSGGGSKSVDITGDVSSGILKFYADNPSGGSITVCLYWTGYSSSAPDIAGTNLRLGDNDSEDPEITFSSRESATNYPRISLTYSSGGGEGEGEGEADTHNFFFLAKTNLVLLENKVNDSLTQLKKYADTKIVLSSSAAILSAGLYLNHELRK